MQLFVVDYGDWDYEYLQKLVKVLCLVFQLVVEGDVVVFSVLQEVQVVKMNFLFLYLGIIFVVFIMVVFLFFLLLLQFLVDVCLKKGDFLLYFIVVYYQFLLGYERIIIFDSSGNVEEVCWFWIWMFCFQNIYIFFGLGSFVILRFIVIEKKVF